MPRKKRPAATAEFSVEERRRAARAMVDGTVCGVVTARYLSGVDGGADGHDVRACIAEAAKSVADGDFAVLEQMLLQQATTLQAMFADLALKAQQQTHRDNLQVMTSLALKAAAGSRQAITALAELRMPKQVLFAKQANVNNGGQQQVNMGGGAPAGRLEPSRAGETPVAPNGLLESPHDETSINASATAVPSASLADPLPARGSR